MVPHEAVFLNRNMEINNTPCDLILMMFLSSIAKYDFELRFCAYESVSHKVLEVVACWVNHILQHMPVYLQFCQVRYLVNYCEAL